MNRRDFLKAGAAAGLTLPLMNAYVAGAADMAELKAYLAVHLPGYMVPSQCILLPTLPRILSESGYVCGLTGS